LANAGTLTYSTKLDDSGFNKGISALGKISGGVFKGIATGVTVATTAVVGLITASTKAYAEYEQLVGGVESMFGGMEKGAEQINAVMGLSKNAWKDLTMSQNAYIQSFNSAYPLMKNDIADQNEAIEKTNRLLTLESDLSNTFGYSMEQASTAVNWALKGTFSYLDNLNIGIKGTQEGFLEAAHNAGYMVDDVKQLSSSDILDILEKTADQFGVLGKTADEAKLTIQGSFKMMQSSWENLLVGMADKNANMAELINQLVESVATFAGNLLPVVEQALLGVGTLIETLLPQIVDRIPTIVNEVLPKLLNSGMQIVTTLINGIQQNLPQIVQGALMMIQTLLMGIIPLLPQILQMGIQIIIELANGLAQMLPSLIPIAVDAIITIVETLIDNIDQLVDAGIELILALADGLIEALPRLIEKAPEIIEKLVSALIKNFPKIVKTGGELIGKLAMGIIGSIFKLVEVAPKLISTIVDGLRRGWNEIKNVGKYLVEGLWNGISGMASWVGQKVREFAGNIVGNIKSALGIHSPSTVFRDEVGKWIPQGIAVGIKADTDSALKALDIMNDEMVSRMNKAVNFEVGKAGTSGITGSVSEILNTNSKIVVENNNTLELDGEKIYENQQVIQKTKNLQYAFGGA
jgi:phage-related protein